MGAAASACPMCAEAIPEAAERCPLCGTTFALSATGYCAACHAVTPATEADACPRCGGGLLDLQVRRIVTEVPAPRFAIAGGAAPGPAVAGGAAPDTLTTGAPPQASTPDTVHAWRPYIGRQAVGTPLVICGFAGLLVGTWFLDWAEEVTRYSYSYTRGPIALPIAVLVLHGVLMWRGVQNQRPRGRRTLNAGEWSRRWKQNRRVHGVQGAYRPVMWALPRTIAAAVVWLGAAGSCSGTITALNAQADVTLGLGGPVALVASLVGFAGTLLCLPTSRRRVIYVDSDGVIYGTKEGS